MGSCHSWMYFWIITQMGQFPTQYLENQPTRTGIWTRVHITLWLRGRQLSVHNNIGLRYSHQHRRLLTRRNLMWQMFCWRMATPDGLFSNTQFHLKSCWKSWWAAKCNDLPPLRSWSLWCLEEGPGTVSLQNSYEALPDPEGKAGTPEGCCSRNGDVKCCILHSLCGLSCQLCGRD